MKKTLYFREFVSFAKKNQQKTRGNRPVLVRLIRLKCEMNIIHESKICKISCDKHDNRL